MRIRERVPWRNREGEHELSRRGESRDPFTAVETQMRHYFDDFFEGLIWLPSARGDCTKPA
jgi:hypothetical protein